MQVLCSMMKAFNDSIDEKNNHLKNLEIWIKSKEIRRSPIEIAKELFSQVKEFKPSDCFIENYELYPEKLGLPLWIAYLNRTINHHNSKCFDFNVEHYEFYFYKQFLLACNVGVDYSMMLHQWQIFVLTEVVTGKQYEDEHIIQIIELHKSALSSKEIDIQDWINKKNQIGTINQSINNDLDLIYHLRRAAFLSIEEVVDIEDIYTSSVEAIADAKMIELLDTGIGSVMSEENLRKEIWEDIMRNLLLKLKRWK